MQYLFGKLLLIMSWITAEWGSGSSVSEVGHASEILHSYVYLCPTGSPRGGGNLNWEWNIMNQIIWLPIAWPQIQKGEILHRAISDNLSYTWTVSINCHYEQQILYPIFNKAINPLFLSMQVLAYWTFWFLKNYIQFNCLKTKGF